MWTEPGPGEVAESLPKIELKPAVIVTRTNQLDRLGTFSGRTDRAVGSGTDSEKDCTHDLNVFSTTRFARSSLEHHKVYWFSGGHFFVPIDALSRALFANRCM